MDTLCIWYGLSVCQPKRQQTVSRPTQAEYRIAARGQSWKVRLAMQINEAMKCAISREQFLEQTVADLVGHGDTGFLERTYCHPQQAQKEQAADTMRTVLRPDGTPIFNLAAACMAKRRGARLSVSWKNGICKSCDGF